jgi:hypothetical protein
MLDPQLFFDLSPYLTSVSIIKKVFIRQRAYLTKIHNAVAVFGVATRA